jgi:hypothetical protein
MAGAKIVRSPVGVALFVVLLASVAGWSVPERAVADGQFWTGGFAAELDNKTVHPGADSVNFKEFVEWRVKPVGTFFPGAEGGQQHWQQSATWRVLPADFDYTSSDQDCTVDWQLSVPQRRGR